MRHNRFATAVIALTLLAGCGWLQAGYDSGRTFTNDSESKITPANVAGLVSHSFLVPPNLLPESVTQLLVAGDKLLVLRGSVLRAFDAASCPRSDNGACPVLWQHPSRANGQIASDGSRVFVSTPGGLDALDLNGTLVWHWSTRVAPAPSTSGRIAVSVGKVFLEVIDYVGNQNFTNTVDSFATSGCGVQECSPLTGMPVGGSSLSPRSAAWFVAEGNVRIGRATRSGFLVTTSGTDASTFDLARIQGCSGTPTVCTRLATYTGASFLAALTAHHLLARDATGTHLSWFPPVTAVCPGSPAICSAGASATTVMDARVAVGGAVVYVTSAAGLDAFDESATRSCSGAPKTCTPLASWSFGSAPTADPIVLDGHVYAATADGKVHVLTLPATIS